MFSFMKSTIATISIDDFNNRFKNGKDVLLDVRESNEYRAGHIKGAINVPLSQIRNYKGTKKSVYVICQSGPRSQMAARQLDKMGYEVTNVAGGMNQWREKMIGGK